MSKITEAYERGVQKGREAIPRLTPAWIENIMNWARWQYPASRELDYWDAILKLDTERMQNPPDAIKFPETKGLPDLLTAERQGFMEGCGGGPREVAFHYTWYFFCTRRLNTRYIGSGLHADHCTAVYIRDSNEGGPLHGRNLDDVRRPGIEDFQLQPPRQGPSGKRERLLDCVSSAVLCDEEPQEIFPVDAWQLMPPDCKRVIDMVKLLSRYTDFWGPFNAILVDEEQNAVALEKSNCRMGVRYSADGTAAVTACAYLVPKMKAFKEERGQQSLRLRGQDENGPDWTCWKGCEARYRRLLKLTDEANRRGATLQDLANTMTDHAVPFPERICLAGEPAHPDLTEGNWTLVSQSSVLAGPHRRTLFWRVEGSTPCYENPPFLVLGSGVEMKPEWQQGVR